MSFSVDDLVSSLSSNHIGQEQMDLATLQAQLAKTLVAGPSNPNYHYHHAAGRSGHAQQQQNTQLCNTPLARTPSTSTFPHSSPWGADSAHQTFGHATRSGGRLRTNSVSSTYFDEAEEDEKMVEDLLMPVIPSTSSMPTSPSIQVPHGYPFSNSYSDPIPSSPTTSLFASTDPFYIAQLQALSQQSQPQTQSVFAQNGRLSQNSPFAVPMQTQQHSTSQWENVSSMPMGMGGPGHVTMARAAAF